MKLQIEYWRDREHSTIEWMEIACQPLKRGREKGWEQFGRITVASGRSTVKTALSTEKIPELLICEKKARFTVLAFKATRPGPVGIHLLWFWGFSCWETTIYATEMADM